MLYGLTQRITGMRPDLAKHALVQVPLSAVENFAKCLFAANLLYTTCIALNKACIIAFYWRLFSVRSSAPLLASAAIVVAWTVAIVGHHHYPTVRLHNG